MGKNQLRTEGVEQLFHLFEALHTQDLVELSLPPVCVHKSKERKLNSCGGGSVTCSLPPFASTFKKLVGLKTEYGGTHKWKHCETHLFGFTSEGF